MEAVNHPDHYQGNKYEVIDIIEDFDLGFCLGNAFKYIARAGKKDPKKKVEDLHKAIWYIEHEIEAYEIDKVKNRPSSCCHTDELCVDKVILEKKLELLKKEYADAFKEFSETLKEYKRVSAILEGE